MRKVVFVFLILVLALPVFAQSDEDSMEEGKTVEVNGLSINYYETEGEGQTIFLIHGNSSSARSFMHQIEDLGETYHIIAMDLPGHGQSDASESIEETYNIPGYAHIVVEVAIALEATDAVFVGWSLGGHILLEASLDLPDAKGLMIFGTPPVGFPLAENAFIPTPNLGLGFTPELTEEQMLAYVTSFFVPDVEEIPEFFMEDIAATDGMARGGLGMSIVEDGFADEVEIVANLEIPLAIIHGELEQLVNLEYFAELELPTLWREEVQVVEGAGHATHWEKPEEFNELLEAFIMDVTAEE